VWVLPLSEIVALQATADAQGRSPVADTVAAAWGYPPGSARFWRSSARHVFMVRAGDDEAFLRLAPNRQVSRADVDAVAVLMDRLASRGLGCVGVLPSAEGNLVETVGTHIGEVHATLVAGAAGPGLDADHLTVGEARAWGAALAAVHRDRTAAAEGLTLADGWARTERDLELLTGDPRITEAVRAVRSRVVALPRTPDVYGLNHGDFEGDNLAWTGVQLMAYDWDEAERSWFAADIAYAVRDLVTEPRDLIGRPIPLLDAFVAGYHELRPEAEVQRSDLVLFTAMNALRSLARVAPVLAEDPGAGASLMAQSASGGSAPQHLRTVVEEYATRQRMIAADLARVLQ
jgi:Ser/Thr protein kinase RdoA (MazF antagonist)